MTFTDPHSFSDLSQGKNDHIVFSIDVDFTAKILNIEAVYSLENPVNGSLFLDVRGLDINRIHAAEKDLAWEVDQQDKILGERLHIKQLENLDNFSIEFTTSPNASALQWVTPGQTAGGEHPFLYTQCQSIHARSVFPCQDTPAVRMTYSAEIKLPETLKAIMAAEHINTEEIGSHALYRFNMPHPIPSYLFAFAVGNLTFKEIGPRTGVYAEPEIIEAAHWEFAENEEKLVAAEKLLGPYLWGRYDLLIMPPSFPFGGMENPLLTFLSPNTILGDRSWTDLISHELAHSWTGNLITNASWEHFWINEGWTTYAESRITEAIDGEAISQLFSYANLLTLKEEFKRFGEDSPLTSLKTSLKGIDPDDVYSTIPYNKGQFFIQRLEIIAGRQRFDAFIQSYISKFKFKSLTTDTFISFLKAELPDVADQVDIQNWIHGPGMPKDAIEINSKLYADVLGLVDAYNSGKLPTKDQVGGWHRMQVYTFLATLPDKIPAKDCRHFDTIFDFEHSKDVELLMVFLNVCLRSEYRKIIPRIQQFAAMTGRNYHLSTVFRAMVKASWARPNARNIFEQFRPRYHPITISSIDNILTEAGL